MGSDAFSTTTGKHHHRPMLIDGAGPEERHSDIFFAAVEATRMPMIITDPRKPDNPIIFANAAFIEMTGYPQEEIIGSNCRFLQGPQTDPIAVAKVRSAVEEQREISIELINYRKDGSTFWNALFISPVHDANGQLLFYFASQLDVSRRRHAEDALFQSKKLEAIGQLTGGVAHDFNNLLQITIGNLDRALIKIRLDSTSEAVALIEQAISTAEKGGVLVQQLLSFARRQRLDEQVVNINDFVQTVVEIASRTMGSSIHFSVDLAGDLLKVRTDPSPAESAILNILLNARDAMPDGGEIRIKTVNWPPEKVDEIPGASENLPDGTYVGLSITDTGTGIPREHIERVTEPFFTTKESGNGMGLASAYGYMRQTGGILHISSEIGQGTTVLLLFPAMVEGEARATSAPAPRRQETVLVVEDQRDALDLVRMVLGDAGYNVLTASNGREALVAAAGAPRIDCLFSDIMMPGGMNGVQLAEKLQETHEELKVLLATGYFQALSNQPRPSSKFQILQKPYRQNRLLEAIRATIDGKAPPDQADKSALVPTDGVAEKSV